ELKAANSPHTQTEQTIHITGGLPALPGTSMTMPVLNGHAVSEQLLSRHSPDDSETSVESSDFAASLEARREIWLATSSSRSPDDGRGVDLAIFTGIWTHSSCRLRLNA